MKMEKGIKMGKNGQKKMKKTKMHDNKPKLTKIDKIYENG